MLSFGGIQNDVVNSLNMNVTNKLGVASVITFAQLSGSANLWFESQPLSAQWRATL